jgi:3-oxoacyl-[acyl-carrier protein] reductase
MFSLKDKIAVVTGASQGIGRDTALALAEAGAKIAVAARNEEKLAELVQEISAKGGEAFAVKMDVADLDQIKSGFKSILEKFGKIDILVNNAAITRDQPLHRMTDDDWRLVHEVALWGTFYMCRSAGRLLRGSREAPPQHHRKVVNMSSSVGIYGAPGTVNYSAAKAGVIGLTKALAREWARYRVNVNAVAPGLIAGTQLTAAKPAELIARVEAQVPLGRAGTPEDVAASVAFLASADADYITGQVLELHGGLEVPT